MAKARGKKSKVSKSRSKLKVTKKSVKKPIKQGAAKKYMRQQVTISKEVKAFITENQKENGLKIIGHDPQKGTLVQSNIKSSEQQAEFLVKLSDKHLDWTMKSGSFDNPHNNSYYIKPQEAKPVAAQAVENKPFVSASPQSERSLRREFTDPAAAAPVEQPAAPAQRNVSIAFVRNEDIATLKNPPRNLDIPHGLIKEGSRLNELDLSSYDRKNTPDVLKQAGISQETVNEIERAISEGRPRVLLIDAKNRPRE